MLKHVLVIKNRKKLINFIYLSQEKLDYVGICKAKFFCYFIK